MKRRTFLTLLAATVSDRALAQATVVSSCGSVTLSAGTPHNVTIDVNGQSCQSGASGGAPTSVWSASDAAANGMTLSNGGLTVTPSGVAGWQSIRGSVSKTSGKLYVEFKTSAAVSGAVMLGMGNSTADITNSYLGNSNYSFGYNQAGFLYVSTGFTGLTTTPAFTVAANDVLQIAVDFTAQRIWLGQNNVWASSGNPSAGTAPFLSFVAATVGALFPGLSFFGTGGVWTLQSTAASQKYAPPSGFTPWG